MFFCCFVLSLFVCCLFVVFCIFVFEFWMVEKMFIFVLSVENLFFYLDVFCCIVILVDFKLRLSYVFVFVSGLCRNFFVFIVYIQLIFCIMICLKDALVKVCATGRIVFINCVVCFFLVFIFELMFMYMLYIVVSLIVNFVLWCFCSKFCSSSVKFVFVMASDASCNFFMNFFICLFLNNMLKNVVGFMIGMLFSVFFLCVLYLCCKFSSFSIWYVSSIF